MSGVLHPTGPEPAQTYWLRRALVLLAVLILVLVSIGLAGASMGATRQTSPPAAAPAAPQGAGQSPSAAPSPTPSAAGESASAPSTSPSAGERDSAAALAPACERKDLKTDVTGKQTLELNQPAEFTVSVRNDSDQTCQLDLTRDDFELKLTSGKQVLWSNKTCTTATFVVAAKLELDQRMSWPVVWDGRGTAAGCAQPGPELKRGTFRATAQVGGAEPAVLPVTLRR